MRKWFVTSIFFSSRCFFLHKITQTTFPSESSINRSLWIAIKHSLQRVLLSQRGENALILSFIFLLLFFGWRNSSEAALMLKLFTTNKHAEGEDCTFPKEVSSRRHTRVLLQLCEQCLLAQPHSHPHTLESDCWGKTKCFCLLCMRRQNEEKEKKKLAKGAVSCVSVDCEKWAFQLYGACFFEENV